MDDEKPPSYGATVTASGVTSSAPRINEGYEPDEGSSKPPTAPPMETLTPERPPFISFGVLTDKDLRDACYKYIEDQCCFGSTFIKDMTLVDIFNSYTFHYRLDSFGERRETKWTTSSYYGGSIDGPENAPPPAVWDVSVRQPTKFQDSRTYVELPHTATVERCSSCSGDGRVRCSSCYGDGFDKCSWCDGLGKDREDNKCTSCDGRGRKKCYRCDGRGRVDCSNCSGQGKVKRYKQLIVTWKKHVDEFISDSMSLPKLLIKVVNGRQIFREENTQIFPISHIPDSSINDASTRLIRKHQTYDTQERIIAQRQTVWAVPLTRAKYLWKKWQGEFYVYGFEKKVYFEHYPQQCCCCTCC